MNPINNQKDTWILIHHNPSCRFSDNSHSGNRLFPRWELLESRKETAGIPVADDEKVVRGLSVNWRRTQKEKSPATWLGICCVIYCLSSSARFSAIISSVTV